MICGQTVLLKSYAELNVSICCIKAVRCHVPCSNASCHAQGNNAMSVHMMLANGQLTYAAFSAEHHHAMRTTD